MRILFWSAAAYTLLGLAGGLYFRTITKSKEFTGDTELAVVHTHFLVLGMLMFLLLMLFEKAFALSAQRGFTAFVAVYHVGVLWTVGAMLVIGTRQVYGHDPGDAIGGIAGMGHIIITVALVQFFALLYRAAVRDRQVA
jgi:hypothetical protein